MSVYDVSFIFLQKCHLTEIYSVDVDNSDSMCNIIQVIFKQLLLLYIFCTGMHHIYIYAFRLHLTVSCNRPHKVIRTGFVPTTFKCLLSATKCIQHARRLNDTMIALNMNFCCVTVFVLSFSRTLFAQCASSYKGVFWFNNLANFFMRISFCIRCIPL